MTDIQMVAYEDEGKFIYDVQALHKHYQHVTNLKIKPAYTVTDEMLQVAFMDNSDPSSPICVDNKVYSVNLKGHVTEAVRKVVLSLL